MRPAFITALATCLSAFSVDNLKKQQSVAAKTSLSIYCYCAVACPASCNVRASEKVNVSARSLLGDPHVEVAFAEPKLAQSFRPWLLQRSQQQGLLLLCTFLTKRPPT